MAKQQPPPEGSLSEWVYERLLDEILGDQPLPGSAWTVVAIAKRLGISRTPVHDAITMLQRDGLLQRAVNQRPRPVRITRNDVHDIYEMRKLLEPEAARRAASRIALPEVLSLLAELDALEGLRSDKAFREAWARHDAAFHRAIATHCGLPRLAADIARYRLLHRALNRATPDRAGLARAVKEHRAILAACEAADPEAASAAMLAHLRAWQRYFTERWA
jgi:DNA-binding GntR family transcriptional regulator